MLITYSSFKFVKEPNTPSGMVPEQKTERKNPKSWPKFKAAWSTYCWANEIRSGQRIWHTNTGGCSGLRAALEVPLRWECCQASCESYRDHVKVQTLKTTLLPKIPKQTHLQCTKSVAVRWPLTNLKVSWAEIRPWGNSKETSHLMSESWTRPPDGRSGQRTSKPQTYVTSTSYKKWNLQRKHTSERWITHKVSRFTSFARGARSPVTWFHGPHTLQTLLFPKSRFTKDVSLPKAFGIGPFKPTWVKFLWEFPLKWWETWLPAFRMSSKDPEWLYPVVKHWLSMWEKLMAKLTRWWHCRLGHNRCLPSCSHKGLFPPSTTEGFEQSIRISSLPVRQRLLTTESAKATLATVQHYSKAVKCIGPVLPSKHQLY
jgi:hypothetical protein